MISMDDENAFATLEQMLSEFIEIEQKKNKTSQLYQKIMEY